MENGQLSWHPFLVLELSVSVELGIVRRIRMVVDALEVSETETVQRTAMIPLGHS